MLSELLTETTGKTPIRLASSPRATCAVPTLAQPQQNGASFAKPALCNSRIMWIIKMTTLLVADRPMFANVRNKFTAFNCLQHPGRYADTRCYRSVTRRRYFVAGRNFFTTQFDRRVRGVRIFFECSHHLSRKPPTRTIPCGSDRDVSRRSVIGSSPDA